LRLRGEFGTLSDGLADKEIPGEPIFGLTGQLALLRFDRSCAKKCDLFIDSLI
jgi:hypothetical protein